ncbi:DUF4352 domain-containing protein [Mycobacterium sp. NBC_00419]|uniref:DUF4352 domain-containing protein n=1 Tax=Mycobacterium sp. NBC_00419 TaxID=2975989 RepID=UPI002E21B5A2
MTQPAPGWFPDPADPSRQRYFDGTAWTQNYAPFGPPAPLPAPVAKPKSNAGKTAVAVGGGLLVLLAVGSAIGDNDKKSTATGSSTSSTARAYSTQAADSSGPSVAPAGSSVRDGKFEFRVIGTSRGGTSMEDTFGTEHAKGEFFVVQLQVTNIGDDARSFSATNQKLIINGNEYKATSFLNDSSWSDDINPGLGTTGRVVFDIPKGAVPTEIEVHDSMFSGGALLAL